MTRKILDLAAFSDEDKQALAAIRKLLERVQNDNVRMPGLRICVHSRRLIGVSDVLGYPLDHSPLIDEGHVFAIDEPAFRWSSLMDPNRVGVIVGGQRPWER